ncbi:hypothetical protein QOT17_000150 [Balamuthia mandrillaris]
MAASTTTKPVYLKVPQGPTRYTKRQLAQLPLRYWLVLPASSNKLADWDKAEFVLLEPLPEVEQQVINQVAESEAKEAHTAQRRQRRKKQAAARATTMDPPQEEHTRLAKRVEDLLEQLQKCEEEKEALRARVAAANQLAVQAAALLQGPSNLQHPCPPDNQTFIAN